MSVATASPSAALHGRGREKLITTTYGITSNEAEAAKIQSSPLDFAYTGYYDYSSGSLLGAATNGSFWSRTENSSAVAYYLYFVSGNVNPQNVGGRGNGRPLRCTAK